ncbi:MAG TPA: phosphatase PAP2 family protein, partial [Acidimicrobiales bacterium]|nr:phosphatase PAP2 family protein [Acidimicrobiales bacterium]
MTDVPRRRWGGSRTTALSHEHNTPPAVRPTRRRPSGAAPPLPKDLRVSGLVWAALAGAVLLFWLVVFLTGRRPSADLVDRTILREVADWRTPSLTRVMRWVQWLGDERVLLAANGVILVVAIAFRRFRHVLVLVGCVLFAIWVAGVVEIVLARPRPVNVPILGEWNGFSHPSRPMVGLGLTLVSAAYTLVPQGRWRVARGPEVPPEQDRTSPVVWVIGGSLLVLAFAQIYLAVENPSDVLIGAIVGVAIPTVAFRMIAPPSAHVDVCRSLAPVGDREDLGGGDHAEGDGGDGDADDRTDEHVAGVLHRQVDLGEGEHEQ